MAPKRNLPILLFYFIFLMGIGAPAQAQIQRHGWNGVIVNEISPRVSVIRGGVTQPMFRLGMSLFEGDEVQTGENGRAEIRFSSNGKGNAVILGANTRVTVKRTAVRYDYSVYRVSVLEGKIWARDLPSQTRKVRVSAGKGNILPFGGQYVVEQDPEQTIAAASSGNIRIMDNSTNRYTPLPPGKIASVSPKTGQLTLMVIPEPLMADFQSIETQAAGKTSKQIKALVADRVARIDEILKQEAKEAAEKKAREEALRKEKEEARLMAAAKAMEKEEEENFLLEKKLVEKKALEMEEQRQRKQAEAAAKMVPVAGAAAQKVKKTAAAESPQPSETESLSRAGSRSQAEASKKKNRTVEQQPQTGKQKSDVDGQRASKQAQKTPPPGKKKAQQAVQKSNKPETNQKKQPAKTEKSASSKQSPVRTAKKKPTKKRRPAVRNRKSIVAPVSVKKEESLLKTYKWDIVSMSTALVFAWMSTEEAKKYNDLESDNNSLQTQWANATTTSERSALEVQYEVNKSKMSTYKANVTLYNNITIVAILFEGYLIYDHLFGDDPEGSARISYPGYKNIMSPDTIEFGLNKTLSPAGIHLTLGWKW